MEADVQDFLEHYGVKGMRWGVRRSGGASNRALNKASRAKDRAKLDREIDKARARTKGTTRAARLGLTDTGSKSHTEYKQARAQYKIDKKVMGSREARKILQKASEKRMKDIQTSQYAKSGKETTTAVLAVVGLTALGALSAARSM